MRNGSKWRCGHFACTAVQVVLGFVVVLVGAGSKVDPKEADSILGATYLIGVQRMAWWALPSAMVLAGAAGLLKRQIGSPFRWEMVKFLLDELCSEVFKKGDFANHSERVTLFKFRSLALVFKRWPWSGWLLPVERSGHLTRRSGALWRVPDSGDGAEGLAGRVWNENKVIHLANLPFVTSDSSPEIVANYAKKTFMSEKLLRSKLKRGKVMPRAMCGIPVEVGSKLWGVIIIDTRNPEQISQKSVNSFLKNHSSILSKLLNEH